MFSVLDFFKGVISSRQHWGKVFDSCRVAEEELLYSSNGAESLCFLAECKIAFQKSFFPSRHSLKQNLAIQQSFPPPAPKVGNGPTRRHSPMKSESRGELSTPSVSVQSSLNFLDSSASPESLRQIQCCGDQPASQSSVSEGKKS